MENEFLCISIRDLSKRFVIISFAILVLPLMLRGQDDLVSYLAGSGNGLAIHNLEHQLAYMENNSFKSPILRELEVRFRTRDLNLSPEDYRLRMGFMNPREQRLNNDYNELHQAFLNASIAVRLNEELSLRYEHLLQYWYLDRKIAIIQDETELLGGLSQENLTLNRSVKDLIQLDEMLLDLELETKKLNSDLDKIKYIIQLNGGISSIDWDAIVLVPMSNMRDLLVFDSTDIDRMLEIPRAELELDEMAYEIEKAQSMRNIGYLQTEYRKDRGDSFDEQLGFQLGLTIPIFNPDRPELQREKLELMEDQNKFQRARTSKAIGQYMDQREFEELTERLEIVDQKLVEVDNMVNQGFDEMEAILIGIEYRTKLIRRKHNIQYDLMKDYIDYLRKSGRLSEQPYINYLSPSFEVFSIN